MGTRNAPEMAKSCAAEWVPMERAAISGCATCALHCGGTPQAADGTRLKSARPFSGIAGHFPVNSSPGSGMSLALQGRP